MTGVATRLRILETPEEMELIEELQRHIWPGNETEIVPSHIMLTAIHNGGLVIGAFNDVDNLVGFVFGFPGLYLTPDGPRPKHCSHMLGVLPEYRDYGVGFSLKRAQWQMVRHQGLDRITWTYDPLVSRNAYLNITKLGAVCNTYLPNEYGQMHDELNVGLPSDRFQVDWWINSQRVNHRLSKRARPRLSLEQYLAAEPVLVNDTYIDGDGLLCPAGTHHPLPAGEALLMVEIPPDFQHIKSQAPEAALEWRSHLRGIFQESFQAGYLVTDFVTDRPAESESAPERCLYILSNGESTL